jgi:hypothetical protein
MHRRKKALFGFLQTCASHWMIRAYFLSQRRFLYLTLMKRSILTVGKGMHFNGVQWIKHCNCYAVDSIACGSNALGAN